MPDTENGGESSEDEEPLATLVGPRVVRALPQGAPSFVALDIAVIGTTNPAAVKEPATEAERKAAYKTLPRRVKPAVHKTTKPGAKTGKGSDRASGAWGCRLYAPCL
ncbi:hypothetical protein EXIGLDRAFT_718157 [Exidia glandulosa HHB12029]|uniref:Uncharacterized protein n=1 Tax=Exidia glandulosa HHB12029 TaxID=1314781 RepID=A0A165HXE1_EXIGL|nr:hypothetical protein EXIGLDRAFT_718157 [Exidia glandulosa HHB12029]